MNLSDHPAPPSPAPTILDPSSVSESEADTYLDTLMVDSFDHVVETLIVDTVVPVVADISMMGIAGEFIPTSVSAVGDNFICENDNDGPAVVEEESFVDVRFRYWTETSWQYMMRTYAEFNYKYSKCEDDIRICWKFCEVLDAASQYSHAVNFIMEFLDREDGAFKIGITYQPWERCYNHDYGYLNIGYSNVTFLCCDENPHIICKLEQDLIGKFRYWGPKGVIIAENGCKRCLNRAPGGESGLHGSSPFFVYVVATWDFAGFPIL